MEILIIKGVSFLLIMLIALYVVELLMSRHIKKLEVRHLPKSKHDPPESGVGTIPDPDFAPSEQARRLINEGKLDECEKCGNEYVLPLFDKSILIGYVCKNCNYHKYFDEKT